MASDLRDLAEIRARLYALPPDEFTAARNDAAKQATGPLARAIKALRRPTLGAWLVNLLAAHRTEELEGLLSLAEELRDAQRSLDGTQLRDLSTRRQAVIASLVGMARDLAADHGRQVREGTLWEAENTLRAAVADPDIGEQVRAGTLIKPVEYSGLGIPTVDSATPEPAAEDRAGATRRTGSERDGQRRTTDGAPSTGEAERRKGRARLRVITGGRAAVPQIPVDDRSTRERARTERIEQARTALAEAERELEEATAAEADASRRLNEIAAEIDELRARERQLRTEQAQVDRERRRADRRRQAAEKAVADARRRLR